MGCHFEADLPGCTGVDRNFHPEGPARGDLGPLLGRWRYRRDALAPQLPARAAQVASFAKDAPSQSSVAPLQLPSACFCGSAGVLTLRLRIRRHWRLGIHASIRRHFYVDRHW